jgi:quercetin dioxygenase-like cupin family protein
MSSDQKESGMDEARIVRVDEGDTVQGEPWLFKATGENTSGNFDLMVGEIKYLSGPPLHTHGDHYDCFFVLEGVLAVQAGEEVFDLGPGDFAAVPPGVPHTFDNVREDQGTVRAINLMSPGVLHDFFSKRDEAGPDAEPKEIGDLAHAHGITGVGPTLGEKLGLA